MPESFDVHTCHTECPCQHGGKPRPDFVESGRLMVFDALEVVEAENKRLRQALELIASPRRPDGTWNRDREACRQLAADALQQEQSQPEVPDGD